MVTIGSQFAHCHEPCSHRMWPLQVRIAVRTLTLKVGRMRHFIQGTSCLMPHLMPSSCPFYASLIHRYTHPCHPPAYHAAPRVALTSQDDLSPTHHPNSPLIHSPSPDNPHPKGLQCARPRHAKIRDHPLLQRVLPCADSSCSRGFAKPSHHSCQLHHRIPWQAGPAERGAHRPLLLHIRYLRRGSRFP